MVEPTLSGVSRFFGLPDWPHGQADVHLGERTLTVFPIPGHESSHIATYDSATKVLLTCDTLYPGLLTVRDWGASVAAPPGSRTSRTGKTCPSYWVRTSR